MTIFEKELLLKDLCGRLPYGVKCKYYDCCEGDYDEGTICGFERQGYIQIDGVCIHIEEVKPYLFPLSSMTEEQKQYLKNRFSYDWNNEPYDLWVCQIEIGDVYELIDWFHKNHIDYRNLIYGNLANDATGLNIY